MGVGGAGYEHQPFQAPLVEEPEGDEERDAPTHGVADKGQLAEVLLHDEAVHEVRMIMT